MEEHQDSDEIYLHIYQISSLILNFTKSLFLQLNRRNQSWNFMVLIWEESFMFNVFLLFLYLNLQIKEELSTLKMKMNSILVALPNGNRVGSGRRLSQTPPLWAWSGCFQSSRPETRGSLAMGKQFLPRSIQSWWSFWLAKGLCRPSFPITADTSCGGGTWWEGLLRRWTQGGAWVVCRRIWSNGTRGRQRKAELTAIRVQHRLLERTGTVLRLVQMKVMSGQKPGAEETPRPPDMPQVLRAEITTTTSQPTRQGLTSIRLPSGSQPTSKPAPKTSPLFTQ